MSHLDTNVTLAESAETLKPYVAQPNQHQRIEWLGRSVLSVLLDGQASGGRLTVIEVKAERGDASPFHIHSQEDETFVVLEGSMTVWIGEERYHIGAGGIGFLPRGLPHGYRFTGDRTRALNICTPSGLENFFRSAGWDLSRPKPEGWAISHQALAESSARAGATILGPPRTED